jgi:hypothetical protein
LFFGLLDVYSFHPHGPAERFAEHRHLTRRGPQFEFRVGNTGHDHPKLATATVTDLHRRDHAVAAAVERLGNSEDRR